MGDNKPHRVTVHAGCSYTWCGCGLARTEQPYCDLTCQNLWLSKIMKGGPIRYIAPETKDLWLCNCKQTDHPPFCDELTGVRRFRAASLMETNSCGSRGEESKISFKQ